VAVLVTVLVTGGDVMVEIEVEVVTFDPAA